MKNKLSKTFWISLIVLAGLAILLFALYVMLYYPRIAKSFEVTTHNPSKRILIATQSSDFKNILTENLCDSLKKNICLHKGN